jgi:hypothetical protein
MVEGSISLAHSMRTKAIAVHGEKLGVRHYEWVEGKDKLLANSFLRLARGTAQPVDAVEIIELDEEAIRNSLLDNSVRACWKKTLSCTPYGFDPIRSFILIGKLRQLVSGPMVGQRVLWFGCGLSQLSEAEFVAHYTGHHGPLVAESAHPLGIRRYRQVASEQESLCDSLRELGLGQATPPPVFAELVMGKPPFNLACFHARRVATREIKADEKRHIDFPRSMLLLV